MTKLSLVVKNIYDIYSICSWQMIYHLQCCVFLLHVILMITCLFCRRNNYAYKCVLLLFDIPSIIIFKGLTSDVNTMIICILHIIVFNKMMYQTVNLSKSISIHLYLIRSSSHHLNCIILDSCEPFWGLFVNCFNPCIKMLYVFLILTFC